MAEFRNVSGQDRHLALPEWVGPRVVADGDTVEIDDATAKKYAWDQAGVWEDANKKAPAKKDGK